MTELSANAIEKVLELKRQYISSFPNKIQNLELCWQKIQTSQFAENEIDELRSVCHKIAGSSGSYELLEISNAAHNLEQLCTTEKQASHKAVIESDIGDGYHALLKLMQQQG